MTVSVRIASLAATAVVALGGAITAPAASADEAPATQPCAQQLAQVEKAEDALARVTVIFERQEARVAKAKHELALAAPGRAKAEARRILVRAKHARDAAKVTKRAQLMRLDKAQDRLEECQAPPVVPTQA